LLSGRCGIHIAPNAGVQSGRLLGEILTAVVTPFRKDGSVDLRAFRSLCSFLLDHGSDGVVVTGTTGESPTLEDDERFALYEAALEAVGDRGTVLAGTGTYSTAHSVHLTERAHELGVHGFLVVTPYYNRPPQRGIVAHVAAVADATDRPVVFYDIPGRVVTDAEPETISRLAEIPNVRAVKQAKPSIEAARHVVSCGLDLYAGDDDLLLPFLEVGGSGGICVYTHVVGPTVKQLVESYLAGDVERAHALDEELRPAIEILRVQTNPIAIKRALQLLGHEVGGLRLPLVEADEVETAQIRDCLERLGLLEAVAA
jgi:4-hydroxy-tetrahydrodipicolinate synthase